MLPSDDAIVVATTIVVPSTPVLVSAAVVSTSGDAGSPPHAMHNPSPTLSRFTGERLPDPGSAARELEVVEREAAAGRAEPFAEVEANRFDAGQIEVAVDGEVR